MIITVLYSITDLLNDINTENYVNFQIIYFGMQSKRRQPEYRQVRRIEISSKKKITLAFIEVNKNVGLAFWY